MFAKLPKPELAYEPFNSLLSVGRGLIMTKEEGYGRSNAKTMAQVFDERLSELGLARDTAEVLGMSKVMILQEHEFEMASNEMFEIINVVF
jgi:hypothetical protein